MKPQKGLALAAFVAVALPACASQDDIGSSEHEANVAKSQLRGYDLGPPFPAGFRDSGLVNGYSECEWVPFVAIIEGSKLEDSDLLAGAAGDGQYGVEIIVPNYSPKQNANGIQDLQVTGTYGEGAITPIPEPFDDKWLADNGYLPLVLGAHADTGEVDLAPQIGDISQRSGPTRFGGDLASASIPMTFTAPVGTQNVEVRFAVKMACPDLQPIAPDGQTFPGYEAGTAKGACSFHPGPGPIFVGYHVGKPTGIATVPIRCDRHTCESDDECPPGDYCGGDYECHEPCVDDSNCPTDQVCEDGQCEEPPAPCVDNEDCEGDDHCVGGGCLPPCPDGGNDCGLDDVACDPDACYEDDGGGSDGDSDADDDGIPDDDDTDDDNDGNPDDTDGDDDGDGRPDDTDTCPTDPDPCDGCVPDVDTGECEGGGGGGGGGDTPPCIYDSQCDDGYVCEDGVCQPPDNYCDMSCPEGEVCEDGTCQPPTVPCDDAGDCPGGETCVDGACHPGTPPCTTNCDYCQWDEDCQGGQVCVEGECHTAEPPVPCAGDGDCPSGQVCEGGYCDVPEPCTDDSDCPTGSVCDNTVDFCVPEHPPIPCDGAEDCPSGDTCTGGFCSPPSTCNDDGDCPSGQVCADNGGVELCVYPHPPVPCGESGDCPSGEVCAGGYCAPDSPTCKNDHQCDGGADCIGGYCLPPTPACDSNLDCPSGVCNQGNCVPEHPPIGCDAPADCPAGDACAGGFCTSDSCNDDGDCPAGSVCDNTVDLCVPPHPPVPCDTAGDCPTGDACEAGYCVPPVDCTDDSDCPGGDVCDNGGVEICVPGQPPTPCDTASDCPDTTCNGYDDVYTDCTPVCTGGFCSPGGGGCSSPGDCPGGSTCQDGQCVPVDDPVACDSQYDCAGGETCSGGFCEPGGTVVECETDQDCFGNDDVGNEECIGGVCYDSPVDFRLCGAGVACPAGNECREGLCQRIEGSCELDGDCPEGSGCLSGWCGVSCETAAECGAGSVCSMNRCVSPCATYSDCSVADTCWSGGCVPKYVFIESDSGSQDLWQVALPGEGDVSGGCGCHAADDGTGATTLLLIGLGAMIMRVRRRRGRKD